MVRDSDTANGSSALEREADRVDQMMGTDTQKREVHEGQNGLNNPVQVEQDNRVDKAKADAKAAGNGPGKPESGLNQDG